jgi:hypothetical protein
MLIHKTNSRLTLITVFCSTVDPRHFCDVIRNPRIDNAITCQNWITFYAPSSIFNPGVRLAMLSVFKFEITCNKSYYIQIKISRIWLANDKDVFLNSGQNYLYLRCKRDQFIVLNSNKKEQWLLTLDWRIKNFW